MVAGGVTVLLTTQYLDEADELADEIVVIDHGRVIASGSPDELKAKPARRPSPSGLRTNHICRSSPRSSPS